MVTPAPFHSKTIFAFPFARVALICAMAALGWVSCPDAASAQEPSSSNGSVPVPKDSPEAAPYQPVDFSFPADAHIDRDVTNIVGNREQWYGTLVFTSHLDVDEIQEFYTNELPAKGWALLSSLIANRVVLQFVNRTSGRACIITIEAGGMWSNTRAEVVVAPLVSSGRK